MNTKKRKNSTKKLKGSKNLEKERNINHPKNTSIYTSISAKTKKFFIGDSILEYLPYGVFQPTGGTPQNHADFDENVMYTHILEIQQEKMDLC